LDFGATLSAIWASIELAALNLLLGADNAVLVALACRALPPQVRKPILVIGLGGAIFLRLGLAALASALLTVPGLRLAAGVFLVWVAVSLLSGQKYPHGGALAESDAISPPATKRFWETVLIVIVADVLMSLDNIVALVSVSQGNLTLLVFGLLLSVPALMYGAFALTKMFDDWPNLILLGAVLLGWIAGQMAVTDELIRAWVLRQAPALTIVLPALCACYVFFAGRPRLRDDLP
jgi:YjbE family integral membrane protein